MLPPHTFDRASAKERNRVVLAGAFFAAGLVLCGPQAVALMQTHNTVSIVAPFALPCGVDRQEDPHAQNRR